MICIVRLVLCFGLGREDIVILFRPFHLRGVAGHDDDSAYEDLLHRIPFGDMENWRHFHIKFIIFSAVDILYTAFRL